MTIKSGIYLALALLGLVVTWYFNLWFLATHPDPGLVPFFQQGYVNYPSSSLTNDVIVAYLTFTAWIYFDAPRHGMKHLWVYPLLGLVLALAFAFPLFLYMRERHLQRSPQA